MYQQRAAPPGRTKEPGSGRWLSQTPSLHDAAGADNARYVVVDDLDDDLAVLVVAPWPEQDANGRLSFGDPGRRSTWSVPASHLHRRVSDARAQSQQEAPHRPLRIGDAFFVEVAGEPEGLDSITRIRDVTREAREQAKLAYFAAVTPRVSPDFARQVALLDPDESPEEPDEGPAPGGVGPSASPAL